MRESPPQTRRSVSPHLCRIGEFITPVQVDRIKSGNKSGNAWKADMEPLTPVHRARPSGKPGRQPLPHAAALPDLGPRQVQAFDHCAECGAGTWVTYGSLALCLTCAVRREPKPDSKSSQEP
jgi:hypothetical protein